MTVACLLPLLCADLPGQALSSVCAAFGSAASALRVEVKLWAMDALALCDHGLSETARFDAIDTSNLADSLELLNLFLMAVPRLESQPDAR